jgi:hypothetical protein
MLARNELPGLDRHPHRLIAASGRRTARLLKLGRILQFPTYPAAPLAVRLAQRQLVVPDSPLLTAIGVAQPQVKLTHSRQARASRTLVWQGVGNSISGGTGTAVRAARPVLPWQAQWLPVTASPRQIEPPGNRFLYAGGLPPPDSRRRNSSFMQQPDPHRIVRYSWQSDFGRPGIRTDLAIDPVSSSPRHGALLTAEPWRPPGSTNRLSDTWQNRPPGQGEAVPRQDDRLAANYESLVASPDHQPGDHQARSRAPTAVTLHLDGSALGRWAVDHLGRVLAKPAKGMTGVDPRATIPRSRVSPF